MTQESKIKCGRMVAVANSYKNSSELLNVINQMITLRAQQQDIRDPNDNLLEFDSVILSRLLLYALDIEILLKAIYLADNDTEITGHDWTILFNNLSDERQSEIIGNMNDAFQGDFHNLLESNKRTFVDWRYSYEYDSLSSDFSFVQNLANVLVNIIMPMVQ